jgi:hypothetical protein
MSAIAWLRKLSRRLSQPGFPRYGITSGLLVTRKLTARRQSDPAMELGFAHQISISSQSGSRNNRPCDGILSARPH